MTPDTNSKPDAGKDRGPVSPPALSPKKTGKKRPTPRNTPRAGGSEKKAPYSWVEPYLKALAKTGQFAAAARAAKIDYPSVWKKRTGDPDFAKREREAKDCALDVFESEAVRRAVSGCRQVRRDAKTGVVTFQQIVYSDTLLLAVLRKGETGSWKDRQVTETVADDFASLTAEERTKRLAEAKARRDAPL